MDTTIGQLKVGTRVVLGRYGVRNESPHPIVWLKASPNYDLVVGNMAGGGANLKRKFSLLRNSSVPTKLAAALMQHELTNANLGIQYAFLTPKSLNKLRQIDTELIEKECFA